MLRATTSDDDGGHADGVGVAEEPGHARPRHERGEDPDQQRDHGPGAGPADLGEVDAEGGGDDGQVANHRPAEEADSRQDLDVRETAGSSRGPAPEAGQDQSGQDGQGGAVHPAPGEPVRDDVGEPDHEADEGEGGDQAVADEDPAEQVEDLAHVSLPGSASSRSAFSATPMRLMSGTSRKPTATARTPASRAAGPPFSAASTFWRAAMATTTGM